MRPKTGKILQKQQRIIFCSDDTLVTGSTLNKHGFFPKPKTNASVPDADGQLVSSTKPGRPRGICGNIAGDDNL